jgi:hypothetical protein
MSRFEKFIKQVYFQVPVLFNDQKNGVGRSVSHYLYSQTKWKDWKVTSKGNSLYFEKPGEKVLEVSKSNCVVEWGFLSAEAGKADEPA